MKDPIIPPSSLSDRAPSALHSPETAACGPAPGPALDAGIPLEVLDDRDRREPRGNGLLATAGERQDPGQGEGGDLQHRPLAYPTATTCLGAGRVARLPWPWPTPRARRCRGSGRRRCRPPRTCREEGEETPEDEVGQLVDAGHPGRHERGGARFGDAARARRGAQVEREVEEGLDEDDLHDGRAHGDEAARRRGDAENPPEDEVGDREAGAEEAEREELGRQVGELAALEVDPEAGVQLVDAVEQPRAVGAGLRGLRGGPGSGAADQARKARAG